MLNVSNAFRIKLYRDERDYICSATIRLSDGTTLNLTNEHIWFNGFSIDDAVSEDEMFTAVGSTIIGSASLTINNIDESYSDYDFTNAKVTMFIGLNVTVNSTSELERLKKGVFWVDDTHYNGSTITLDLLDNMMQFDRPYDTTLVYPARLDQIVMDACTKCGVTYATVSFPHQDYIVEKKPDAEATTYREVLGWASSIAGCFARCNVDGELEIKWFDQTHYESWADGTDGGTFNPWNIADAVNGGTFNPWNVGDALDGESFNETRYYHNIYALYSQDICIDDVVITGVRILVEADDEETGSVIQSFDSEETVEGVAPYIVELSGNPFITVETAPTIVEWLADKLIGLKFRKLNVTHANDPSMEAGDMAVVWDRKGRAYPILVTRTSFSVNSPQTTVCGAETPSRNSANRFSSVTKTYVDRRKELLQERNAWELAQEQVNETLDNAQGLYYTEEQTESGDIMYLHNRIRREDSSKVIKISDAGIYVTDNYQDDPPTWAGLSMSGSLLAKFLTVIGINADWINTGTLNVYKVVDGQSVLVMSINKSNGEVYMNPTYILVGDGTNDTLQYVLNQITQEVEDIDTWIDGVDLTAIKSQIDQKIETHMQSSDPSLAWNTDDLKSEHEGDLWYKTLNGENTTWRWTYDSTTQTYSWEQQNVPRAVFDEIDGKMQVFVSQPTPPYNVGDLWFASSTEPIKTCKTARTASEQFNANDWEVRNNEGGTATNFLYFDPTNGLTISEVGANYGTDTTKPYNVQLKGSGINFRKLADVLMYMGVNNNSEAVITMNRTPGGLKAMELIGSALSFYGEITDPYTNVTTNKVVTQIGVNGLEVQQGVIGDFVVTITGAADRSVENGGHIYARSFYCNYTGDSTYNYEYGIHGNQSDKGTNNIVFYVARTPKNSNWTSNVHEFLTYLYVDGKFVTKKAEIGGWTVAANQMSANNILFKASGGTYSTSEIILGGYSRGSGYGRKNAYITSDGNFSGNYAYFDHLYIGDDLLTSGANSWSAFEVDRSLIRAYVPIRFAYTVGQSSGDVLVVASDGTIVKQYPSSKRYKDIDRLLTKDDIINAYNINVYRAKFKDGFCRKGDYRDGQYMPMLIAEEVAENIPEAATYNSDGLVENWDYRIMIPVHQQMLLDQNKRIKELESEVAELKEQVNQLIRLMKGNVL